DPPFSRLDLILCRNVLIYFDTVLQERLISVFHYALRPDGFLVLGPAETVGAQLMLFSLIDKKHRVHQKKAVTSPATSFALGQDVPGVSVKKSKDDPAAAEKYLQTEVNPVLMDRLAPP